MNGKIVRTYTSDNLNLQGILYGAELAATGSPVVLHIHGSYGNFYENFFLDDMAQAYRASNVAFLSVNTRGHDYYADFKRQREDAGYDSKRIGGIRENFEDCIIDIGAWLTFAEGEGFHRVILQGHSLGAMKVAYYAARESDRRICALFLLSPPDNFGLQVQHFGSRFAKDIELAKQLRKQDPDSLMATESYFDPITVAAYLALLGDESKTGMFSYYNKAILKHPITSSITVPTFATFGTKDEAVTLEVQQCVDLLRQALESAECFEHLILKGANHSYHGLERELSQALAAWAVQI